MLSTASAHVQIIDLAEMDQQLLGGTPEQFMRRQAAADEVADKTEAVDPIEAAKQLVRDARKCYHNGSLRAADYYYRRAVAELPPELSQIATAEYARFLRAISSGQQRVAAR